MSDELRRGMLRRAVRGDDPEALLAWYRDCLRAGQLPPDALRLLALLGDAAAAGAAGEPSPSLPDDWDGLSAWVERLGALGKGVSVRAALAAAEQVGAVWAADYPGDARLSALLRQVSAWLESPGPARVRQVRSLRARYDGQAFPCARYAWAAVLALDVVLAPEPAASPDPLLPPAEGHPQAAARAVGMAVDRERPALSAAALREAVRTALLSWVRAGAPGGLTAEERATEAPPPPAAEGAPDAPPARRRRRGRRRRRRRGAARR